LPRLCDCNSQYRNVTTDSEALAAHAKHALDKYKITIRVVEQRDGRFRIGAFKVRGGCVCLCVWGGGGTTPLWQALQRASDPQKWAA
jgi:hypothetical protein